jgi:hypothetical protein
MWGIEVIRKFGSFNNLYLGLIINSFKNHSVCTQTVSNQINTTTQQ